MARVFLMKICQVLKLQGRHFVEDHGGRGLQFLYEA